MELICLIAGHNKVLDVKHENGSSKYYTVCSDCHKKWPVKQLNEQVNEHVDEHIDEQPENQKELAMESKELIVPNFYESVV